MEEASDKDSMFRCSISFGKTFVPNIYLVVWHFYFILVILTVEAFLPKYIVHYIARATKRMHHYHSCMNLWEVYSGIGE